MWSRGTMLLLWCIPVSAIVVVLTQSAAVGWPAYTWVVASLVLAVVATSKYRIEEKQRRRWDAGDYD